MNRTRFENGSDAPAVNRVDDLLDAVPCGLLSFSEGGTVQLVNQTLLDLLGFPRDQVVGRHVENILTVGGRIFYQTHWFPLLQLHGRADEIFLMLRTASGEDAGVLVNAVRRERDGRAVFDCVFMQVRERQKYEDALLRARRAAEQARAELEVQKRELEQANDLLRAQTAEMEQQQQQLQEQAAELEAVSEELESMNDALIARTREAEELRSLAEQANSAKSAFLAVMSHELRTPLNAIAGYLEILDLGIHGPITGAQRETLSRMTRSQRHLLRLINDVLNLARIEAGHVDYLVEDVPVEEIVSGVVPMIEPQLETKAVGFEVQVEPGLIARGDRDKAQQILLNLLSNAVKFTPEGGSVLLSAALSARKGGQIGIRVSDTGIGIPPDKLDSVFQPFVQVDVSRTRGPEGTGLGLAISRDLAHGMDGELVAESTPGEGSTFILYLPLAGASNAG